MALSSINPATGETLAEFREHGPEEIQERLEAARLAFRDWRPTDFSFRSRRFLELADLFDRQAEDLGRLMALEMGKPIRAGAEEARKCAAVSRYYAENAEQQLAHDLVAMEGSEAFVRYEPLGPVLAVMPWNFPFWQVLRFAAPALMAGNVALLKHASNVPQCALRLESLFLEAGFPPHVFQTLLIEPAATEALIADRRVAAVTLTGSEAAGRRVAALAGAALKKAVLELGGSDPFIVMPSADLALAAKIGTKARTVNSGQSCIAAKRFLIHEAIYERFLAAFSEAMAGLKMGDPLEPETALGPLATPSILEGLEKQMEKLIAARARVILGGKRMDRVGNFFPPTIVTDIPREAAIACEEVFGPIALVFKVTSVEDAIALANGTDYGLGASVWTKDAAERERFIREIEAGQIFVNAMTALNPALPFGGIKHSGYGRELGPWGIREFVNVKTVCLAEGEQPAARR